MREEAEVWVQRVLASEAGSAGDTVKTVATGDRLETGAAGDKVESWAADETAETGAAG